MKGNSIKKFSSKYVSSYNPNQTQTRQRKLSDMLLTDSYDTKEQIIKKVKKNSDEENNAFKVKIDENDLNSIISDEIIIKKLIEKGITKLFPIQEITFPKIAARHDLLARDRTGSGKTLAYVLPLCQHLSTPSSKKVLVLLPTRELVTQVSTDFDYFLPQGKDIARLYGGVEYSGQIQQLKRRNNAVIVGTPGRIIDLFEHHQLQFQEVETVVIDEADHMFDMGFQDDIEKILSMVKEQSKEPKVQFLLWSATFPHWIHQIVGKFMQADRDYVDLVKSGNASSLSVSTVRHLALNCPLSERISTIGSVLLCYGGPYCYCIVFTETKQDANDVMLHANIKQDCQVLHGDIPQKQRELTFKAFREGKFKCLIATNVAARGLDIPQVDLIVQLDPPKDLDTYIHRAGRTARAGKSGTCITFYRKNQLGVLNRIARHARIQFTQIGTPQPADIISQGVKSLIEQLKELSPSKIEPFIAPANQMITDLGGSETAIQKILCFMIGSETVVQRSLLCAFTGFVTFIAVKRTSKQQQELIENKSIVWRFLREKFGEEVTNRIKGVRVFKDKTGAAFDIKEEDLDLITSKLQEINEKKFPMPKFFIERATQLPELEDPEDGYANAQNHHSFGQRVRFDRNAINGGRFDRNAINGGRFDKNAINGASNSAKDSFSFNNNKSRSFGGKSQKNSALEIFVGNVEKSLQEQDLKEFFNSNNVSLSKLNLLHDEDGNSKGACFVACRDVESLNEALQLNGYELNKRKLRINMANEKS